MGVWSCFVRPSFSFFFLFGREERGRADGLGCADGLGSSSAVGPGLVEELASRCEWFLFSVELGEGGADESVGADMDVVSAARPSLRALRPRATNASIPQLYA